jgi:hypothetical protein
MTRSHKTAAALLILAFATSGCVRNRALPTGYAPSKVTTLAVNTYLWRAWRLRRRLPPAPNA